MLYWIWGAATRAQPKSCDGEMSAQELLCDAVCRANLDGRCQFGNADFVLRKIRAHRARRRRGALHAHIALLLRIVLAREIDHEVIPIELHHLANQIGAHVVAAAGALFVRI
jgi:hypothetical protein